MTSATTGRAVLDLISTGFWAGGRAIHHSTNAYQGARRFYRNEIASGALRADFFAAANRCQDLINDGQEACDRFLTAWQSISDDLRALLVCCLGPIAALLWGAAYDVAMGMARTLGRAWGCWMGQSRYDLPLAMLSQVQWFGAIASARSYIFAVVRALPAMCDRAFCLAFSLEAVNA
jgi:hypothetical protein